MATVERRQSHPRNRIAAPSRLVVGRSRSCDVVVEHGTVSRRHALLRRAGDDWVVEDLGSSNWTAVNGEPIHGPTVLHPGDIVMFGVAALRFEPAADGCLERL